MIRTFKVEVTRVDEYKIVIDDAIVNDDFIKNFEKSFWELEDDVESVAKYLAIDQARNGEGDGFMEGFGYVTRDGKLPHSMADFDKDGNWLPVEQRRKPTPGYDIIILSEDYDIDTDVTEITEEKGDAGHEQN